MRLTAQQRRYNVRIHPLIGAGILSIALAGCSTAPAPAPAPIAVPTRSGALKLCTGSPASPPNNLASNPKYLEFSVDVIDSTGAPTIGLTQSDFVATEDSGVFATEQSGVVAREDARPIPIAYFRAEQSRPPVSIAILVDKSASMVTKLPVVSSSVDALMPKLDACDEVMLYAFGEMPELVQDFTTDHALVAERLKLVGAGGKTPFFDGVQQGTALLDKSHYPDRAAIIFTDDLPTLDESSSLDNASQTATRKDIVSLAVNSQRRFFVVGVGDPHASKNGLAVAIGPFIIGGNPPDGVDAQDLKTFAADLEGGFYLVTSVPDNNAPKVSVPPPPAANGYPPAQAQHYSPMAADPAELQQFATSLSSQIDTHYTLGFISSRPPSSPPSHIAIKTTRPTTRTTFHQIVPP
jgi:hypothetical protein